MESKTNFKIRDNMRAGYGIIYREGNDHVDQGPSYQDMLKASGQDVQKLTVNQYKSQHSQSNFNQRDVMKQLADLRVNNQLSSELPSQFERQVKSHIVGGEGEEEDMNQGSIPQGTFSTNRGIPINGIHAATLAGTNIDKMTMFSNETRTNNRSQIEVHSNKGYKDIITSANFDGSSRLKNLTPMITGNTAFSGRNPEQLEHEVADFDEILRQQNAGYQSLTSGFMHKRTGRGQSAAKNSMSNIPTKRNTQTAGAAVKSTNRSSARLVGSIISGGGRIHGIAAGGGRVVTADRELRMQ